MQEDGGLLREDALGVDVVPRRHPRHGCGGEDAQAHLHGRYDAAELVAARGQQLRGVAAGRVPAGQLAEKRLERPGGVRALALGATHRTSLAVARCLALAGHSPEEATSSISAEHPPRDDSGQCEDPCPRSFGESVIAMASAARSAPWRSPSSMSLATRLMGLNR